MVKTIPLIKRNEKIVDCFLKVKRDYLKFLSKEKIFDQSVETKIAHLRRIYIPMSFWIDKKYKKKGKTLFLGLSGGQGSGKTTVTGILKIILKKYFKRKIHTSSIDDFYKTLEERDKISNTIHPLFKTRGVPGTHDTNLIKKFFDFIKKDIPDPFNRSVQGCPFEPRCTEKEKIDFKNLSLKNGLAINMGNPHVVFFVNDINKINISEIGPLIENNSLFPEKVNVEICQILNKNKIRALVWERGAGKTLACGSGACASLVAAHENKLSNPKAEIVLDGGSLNITWNVNSNNHVIMSGPIAVSFLGDLSTLGLEK